MSYEPINSGNSSAAPTSNIPTFTTPQPLHFPSSSFVLSACTLSFHPPTRSILIVTDTMHNPPYWFLPCGRKEINESLSNCAIRETFVNAGYRINLLPSTHETLQPSSPYFSGSKHTEVFWILLHPYSANCGQLPTDLTGLVMDLSHYFLGVVEDTTRDAEYGKAYVGRAEEGYDSALVEVEEAVELLSAGRMEVREQELIWKEDGSDVLWEDIDASDVALMEAVMIWKGWGEVAAMPQGEAIGKATESEDESLRGQTETNRTREKPTHHHGRSGGRNHRPKRGRGWKPYKGKRHA